MSFTMFDVLVKILRAYHASNPNFSGILSLVYIDYHFI